VDFRFEAGVSTPAGIWQQMQDISSIALMRILEFSGCRLESGVVHSAGVILMSIYRLSDIEENLESLREQLGGKEKARVLARLEDKTLIKQQIRELCKEIQEEEEKYWQVLAQQTKTVEIPEQEAEIIVAEIVEGVGQIEVQRQYPDEVIQILQEIRDKLNQPGATAAAKLKGVISSIPPFVGISYEAELDTENFFQRHFPTFRKLIKVLAKKS
jgi:Glu-tRNA(Gln) amidotransferase subunit E-like FAD-binding protein